MYKGIVFLISLTFIVLLNNCSISHSVKKKNDEIVIKYYRDFNEVFMRSKYEEKHTFYDEISEDIAKKEIANPLGGANNSVFKVYYANNDMYKQHIPIKAEQYQSPNHIDIIWWYDKYGRLIKFEAGYKVGIYQYKNNEKISIDTYKKPSQYRHYQEQKCHYFYDEHHRLIKMLMYYDNKLESIYRPDKKNRNLIHEYDLNNNRISTWDITVRKGE